MLYESFEIFGINLIRFNRECYGTLIDLYIQDISFNSFSI